MKRVLCDGACFERLRLRRLRVRTELLLHSLAEERGERGILLLERREHVRVLLPKLLHLLIVLRR